MGGARAGPHHQGPVHEPAGGRGKRRGASGRFGRGRVDRGHAGRRGGAAQSTAGGGGGLQGTRPGRPARLRDDGRRGAAARPLGPRVRAPGPGDDRRHDHLWSRVRWRLRGGLDLLGAGGRAPRCRRRRRRRRDGAGHRRYEHAARVLRHGGRGSPRRRRRPRRPADRVLARLVRRPEVTARRAVAPHADGVAAGLPRAGRGGGAPPRRRRGGASPGRPRPGRHRSAPRPRRCDATRRPRAARRGRARRGVDGAAGRCRPRDVPRRRRGRSARRRAAPDQRAQ